MLKPCGNRRRTAGAAPESLTRSRPCAIRNPGWGTLATPLIRCQQRGSPWLPPSTVAAPSHRWWYYSWKTVAWLRCQRVVCICIACDCSTLHLSIFLYDGDGWSTTTNKMEYRDGPPARSPTTRIAYEAAETRNHPWALFINRRTYVPRARPRQKLREAFL